MGRLYLNNDILKENKGINRDIKQIHSKRKQIDLLTSDKVEFKVKSIRVMRNIIVW